MLSVIIPVYNTVAYLDDCVTSVLEQSGVSLEVVLIDDCSTDGSSELVDLWSAKDSRVVALHNPVNSGVSYSRNVGLSAAKGDYIAFVDSDDWVDADYYSQMVSQLELTDADICLAGYTRHERDKTIQVSLGNAADNLIDRKGALALCMPQRGEGRYNLYIVDKVFQAKTLFSDGKLVEFDPSYSYCEDVLWLMEVFLNAQSFACCDTCGYHYRTNRDGNTWSRMKDAADLSLCESALATNRRIYSMLSDVDRLLASNQMQRVLFYQEKALRTAAKLGDVDAYRKYSRGFISGLLQWYPTNRTLLGLKWLIGRLLSHAKFVLHCRKNPLGGKCGN